MASGFLSGFAKGAVVATLALAGLSLIAPQPKLRGLPQEPLVVANEHQEAAADVTVAGSGTAPETLVVEADSSVDVAPDTPPTMDLPLPVGSEFARGSDDAPRLPAPLTPTRSAIPTDAPVVAVPASEMQPVGTATPSARPQPDERGPAAPPVEATDSAPINLPSAPLAEVLAGVPVAMQSPALEKSPQLSESAPATLPEPIAEAVQVKPKPPVEVSSTASAQAEPVKPREFRLFLPPSINELIPSTN